MASTRKEYVTCTCCPAGCLITVTLDGYDVVNVEGYTCSRGKKYASNEVIRPVRSITATVLSSLNLEPVSVKTAEPVPKDKIQDIIKVINDTKISKPVKIGDVIIADVCSTGVDVVATKSIS